MKTNQTIKAVVPLSIALVTGYITLVFFGLLYPSVLAPHTKAVPLPGVSILGFEIDRSGMIWCVVAFGIVTISLFGFSMYMFCARRRNV